MTKLSFIPKDDQSLPDAYGLTIYYIDGKSEAFEIAQHVLNKECRMIEFVTKDDEWNWTGFDNAKRFKFDKRLSEIIEVKNKKQKE